MSGWLIVLTGAIYAAVSVEQFWKGEPAMGIVYFGYAVANCGIYFLVK
jgi:hypothetical protein